MTWAALIEMPVEAQIIQEVSKKLLSNTLGVYVLLGSVHLYLNIIHNFFSSYASHGIKL